MGKEKNLSVAGIVEELFEIFNKIAEEKTKFDVWCFINAVERIDGEEPTPIQIFGLASKMYTAVQVSGVGILCQYNVHISEIAREALKLHYEIHGISNG